MVSFRQSMRAFRLLLLAAGALALVLVVAAAVVFSSSFQTWVVRNALAKSSEVRASVGRVDAGLKDVRLREVRYERGGAVLTIPTLEADLPVLSAAFADKILVGRLVAKGWTLDLSKATDGRGANASGGVLPPAAVAAPEVKRVTGAFAGIFGHLKLPVDVALEGVQLEGEVILPASRGRVKLSLTGGGLRAGGEGKFTLVADAALTDPKVNAVQVRGTLIGAMDTPRTFTQLATNFEAAASGAQFPQGVKLTAGATAARSAMGESYSATILGEDRQLLVVKAEFPRDASRLDGTWKLDVRDVDVAPFALGHPLPAFTAVGDGKFDSNAAFSVVHVAGRLNATAGRLEILQPQLGVVGAVKIAAEFDVAQRGGAIGVQELQATISSAQPIATVTALQGFEFDSKTQEVRAADATRELVGVVLHGLPLAWAKPFLGDLALTGSDVRGEVVATARGGGVALRSRVPLAVEKLNMDAGAKPWLRAVDVSFNATADYTPQGWQAEVSGFTAKSGATVLATLDAKAGQLAVAGQPLKTTGKLVANLGAVLQQPIASGALALSSGDAVVEFIASVADAKALQAKLALKNLTAIESGKPVVLPAVAADVRVDVGTDGKIALSVPLALEREARKSDLTLAGAIGAPRDKVRAIEAQVTSTQLVLDDATMLAAALPGARDEAGAAKAERPLWHGFQGTIDLQLKKVVYSETFALTNVGGRLRLEAGAAKLETVQMGVGETGRAALNGTVTFDPSVPLAYGFNADVAVREFDPAPLFRALNSTHPATVEGRFDIASKLSSRAARLGELAAGAGGTFQLTSKGGVFRGLPVTAGNVADSTSTIASLIASASSMIGGLTGRKDASDISNRSQAVSELAKGLSAIAYDQLSLVLARDAQLNAQLKEFSLISPEVRLTGSGKVEHRPGGGLLASPVAMEFNLRAQGRAGSLLRYLGLLDAQADDLGYAACTVPITIAGTLGSVDASEASRRLVAAAFEKAGFIDKAADWLSKQRSGK